ncbi:MAG TPA: aldehyde dehydrogenase (NADP(+)) [Acidobacteriaceae bacterium]|nr:aldehyde dehydrogenase (NADP(+)) [Acidobacteriaceae bacterium]
MTEMPSTIEISGEMLIGARAVRGSGGAMQAVNPANGKVMEPTFCEGTAADVDAACELAEEAFDAFRAAPLEQRAKLLETIAQGLIDLGDVLVERVMEESGLPRPRVEGERARTAGQLRLFATLVREGRWLQATIDRAMPERKPLPRADLRAQRIPLGPVAVFGASNFPLAFSVAGGDTASALAAGCPVVAKAHPSHPGTSELAGRVIQKAVAECGLPEGVFSLLVGGAAVGEALVKHPAMQAVGFTGSRRVGRALVALAAARDEPIPVYAEMSSVNPVFLLPGALAERAEKIAQGWADSVTLGTGQFCTKPGIAIGIASADFERLRTTAKAAIEAKAATTMLNPGIHGAYCEGAAAWVHDSGVQEVAGGAAATDAPYAGRAMVFATTAKHFLATPRLLEEVFGPAALLVECVDEAEMLAVAKHFDGQLTATMQLADADHAMARRLLPILERKAGRIIVNGFPTGVEVCHAMVHGGPSPSTSDSRVTSVGSMAIERWLRPVCYQDLPADLLPEGLQEGNPLGLWRLVEGKPGQA